MLALAFTPECIVGTERPQSKQTEQKIGIKCTVNLTKLDNERKGFNGLYGLVSTGFGEDPRSGALYVFCNRRHTRIKVLYFDGTGLWVLSKRLERGTFSWPKPSQVESPTLKLSPEAFAMLTDGVDLRGAKLRPWYERE